MRLAAEWMKFEAYDCIVWMRKERRVSHTQGGCWHPLFSEDFREQSRLLWLSLLSWTGSVDTGIAVATTAKVESF